ncbi:hybrid sensor histidine kinase/response regulator [Chitinimonas arctica]|nr:ATP-binding protein [Chitinimonas arctica]
MPLPALDSSAIARVTLTAILCVLPLVLQGLFVPFGSRIPFLFFLPSLMLGAMLIGRWSATLVWLTGVINGVSLLSASVVWSNDPRAYPIALLAYAGIGLLLIHFCGNARMISRRAAEAERRLGLAQEKTGVGLFEIDVQHGQILASPTLWRLIDRAPINTAVPLAEWQSMWTAADVAEENALLQRKLAADEDSYEYERHIVLPNGQQLGLLTKVHIERDDMNRLARLHGVLIDITERKRVDALLAETQAELTQQVADLQHLHELSSRLLELSDLPSQLQAILQALADFLGSKQGVVALYEPGSGKLGMLASVGVRGTGWPGPTAPVCELACREKRRIVIADTEMDTVFSGLAAFARAQGFRSLYITPLIGGAGEMMGVITLLFALPFQPDERALRLTDICVRKAAVFIERARARAIAQETNQRFRVALESSAVPFMILQPLRGNSGKIDDFRCNYLNAAALDVLRVAEPELIGHCLSAVLPGTWEEPGLLAHYTAVVEQGEAHEFEVSSVAAGIRGWFHVIASPMQGAVAIWFADVTQRKQQEQALRDAAGRKDEFLATLAHELRNPLAPIRQAALISKSPSANEAQKNWSHDVIDRQVQHMALLLDDLLDISRITRGMLHLRKRRTELAAVVEAAVETVRPSIDAKQHHLTIDIPSRPVYIEVDQLRLAQVLANLLTNAAKYTDPRGYIRLSAECVHEQVMISVTDTGIGIKSEALSEVFQMFNQVRSVQDRSDGGLGIGLALAKGLVELHGGTIHAYSAGPGKGSQFTLQLPSGVGMVQAIIGEDGTGHTPKHSRRRILVADDNLDAVESLAELLRLNGHEVAVAHDGEAALNQFNRFQPEIALLDIGMPKLNGNELAQQIRRSADGKEAMLIAITGWGQDKDKSLALASGFDHHMTKPVDFERLNQLILAD